MRGLGGRVAVVTGAARHRGIGRAVALRLAEEGCAVAIVGSPRAPSSFPPNEREIGWQGVWSVAEEVTSAGGRAAGFDCDVRDKAQVERCVADVVRHFGRIDVLVNNASVSGEAGGAPLLAMEDDLWYRTVDVNLHGFYRMTKATAAVMTRSGGSIVNLSSTAGRQAMANSGAYTATKWAIIGLTQQLALELAPAGIRVNCVCPGATPTDMTAAYWQNAAARHGVDPAAVRKATAARVPLGRLGRADEQASVIAFLASDEASYVTGQTLNVDGGLHMD